MHRQDGIVPGGGLAGRPGRVYACTRPSKHGIFFGPLPGKGARVEARPTCPVRSRHTEEVSMSMELSVVRASAARRIAVRCIAVTVAASLWGCSRTDGLPIANFATSEGQLLVRAKSIQWGPAPPSLPAGAKAALLQGNPGASGPFVMRLQLPA